MNKMTSQNDGQDGDFHFHDIATSFHSLPIAERAKEDRDRIVALDKSILACVVVTPLGEILAKTLNESARNSRIQENDLLENYAMQVGALALLFNLSGSPYKHPLYVVPVFEKLKLVVILGKDSVVALALLPETESSGIARKVLRLLSTKERDA